MGLQLGVVIGLFTYGGSFLDDFFELENSPLLVAGSLTGVIGGMTSVIYQLIRESKD